MSSCETMDRNEMIQLHNALHYIWEKNNRMVIWRNKYFMLKELPHTTIEHGKNVDPIEVAQLLVGPKYISDTEMFNENTKDD